MNWHYTYNNIKVTGQISWTPEVFTEQFILCLAISTHSDLFFVSIWKEIMQLWDKLQADNATKSPKKV